MSSNGWQGDFLETFAVIEATLRLSVARTPFVEARIPYDSSVRDLSRGIDDDGWKSRTDCDHKQSLRKGSIKRQMIDAYGSIACELTRPGSTTKAFSTIFCRDLLQPQAICQRRSELCCL